MSVGQKAGRQRRERQAEAVQRYRPPDERLAETALEQVEVNSTCAIPWPVQVNKVASRNKRAGRENERTASL